MVEEVRDRNIWGRIIKEAKVHKGLQSQRKKMTCRCVELSVNARALRRENKV
jgi:hypothetical protein